MKINSPVTAMKASEKITSPIIPITNARFDFCAIFRIGSFAFPTPTRIMRIEHNMKYSMHSNIIRNPSVVFEFPFILF
ncbi:hypothetical protein [uncultured Treponema sp.]|uniref:hypothetical protein n=1 Tax=uncultured Treponema sp. TaxID=162155 RepID=UPI0025FE2405|nr:hypothetical protein [uncultured Treponema sp.]